jgi:hypothetical protein
MYTFTMNIEVNPDRPSSATEITTGSLAWGTSAGDTATMTLMTAGSSTLCNFDLESFQLSECT